MIGFRYVYEAVVKVDDGASPAALGAAVTVALCGHWDHQPPCRWPHHTSTSALGEQTVVRVSYDCEPDDEPQVRGLIEGALASRSLVGPDGETTKWTVIPDASTT